MIVSFTNILRNSNNLHCFPQNIIIIVPSGDKATESDLSSGGVIGITAGFTLLVALPVGVVLGCWGRIWWTRPAQNDCSSPSSCWKKKRRSREQTVIYEEPDVVGTTAISLSDNEAYAINTHQ